mgnify:CR=1 FL=1
MPSLNSINPELIFSLASGLAFVSWLALAVSPYRARWSARVRLAAGYAVPLLFAVVYVLLFVVNAFLTAIYFQLVPPKGLG